MKTVKLSEFIAYLIEQIGQPYVWGGQHTKLTPQNYVDVITRKEKTEENRENAIAFCKRKFDEGATVLYAYDCSGLGMYWLQNLKHIFKSDMSANGMMGQCVLMDEPKKGYWVFRLDDSGKAVHIGYMVSDTYVIHAKGRAYGVCKERYSASFWHRIGKPKCVNFDNPEPKPTGYEIKVLGSVNVREGNGVLTKKIATVKNCNLPYLGQAVEKPNWYLTIVNGKQGYITSNPKYTRIVEVVY
jgi:cell wall-associated NlpC family hydrolase